MVDELIVTAVDLVKALIEVDLLRKSIGNIEDELKLTYKDKYRREYLAEVINDNGEPIFVIATENGAVELPVDFTMLLLDWIEKIKLKEALMRWVEYESG